jgi:hypothetical protein
VGSSCSWNPAPPTWRRWGQPHHGLLVDFDYRIDTDVDTANVLEADWKTDFALGQPSAQRR